MKALSLSDRSYPTNLKEIAGAPKKLYVKGSIVLQDTNAVAIVGSRLMTKRGREIAYEFAYELAKRGVTIVSGLARGIDTIAHKAALEAGGRTISVLGSGFDNLYPPENIGLIDQIAQNGAVITEFPPQTLPLGKNFLVRNRIISGLSKAVIVIEGRKRSGTLSTATHAANQGREVFAIAGSELPDYLIENGANSVAAPVEIMDYLDSIT
jgi:DNA processing protein